ncbi:MAG: ribosome small subunit-dependent GTPase A [Cyanobacteriota bacterium]|nr:ribosome small subunit-dependent GTPase A [Cyanobacteriota bacterium]
MAEPGRVVAVEANFCRVELHSPGPQGQHQLLCTRRARLAKGGLSICVGDWVQVDHIDWGGRTAVIAARGPRSNLLSRPTVANVARVAVVVSLKEPHPDPLQITRFLVSAEHLSLPVELVLSKAEDLPEEVLRDWCGCLRDWGYDPLPVSTRNGMGIQALSKRLAHPGITVLCGPSGVGKSSLLNALVPGLALRVSPVSGRLQRGRHTTRHVALLALPGRPDALVADTPGFNLPALPESPLELARCFPELRVLAQNPCRFVDCRHGGEAGCAMGADWPRQALYRQCLAEVEALAPGRRMGPARETVLREASRRRRRRHLQGEITPPDLED